MSVFFKRLVCPGSTFGLSIIMVLDPKRIAFNFAAFAFLSIGVLQVYSKEILIGRPPLTLIDGWYGTLLAWTVGVLLIANGILLIMRRSAIIICAIGAGFVLLYCVLPNFWLVAGGDTGIALTGFGKGISLATGLLLLTAVLPFQTKTQRNKVIMLSCNYALGIFLLTSGVQHFLFAPFVMTLIPSWIPFAGFWTYAAGGLLALGGLCLITGFKRRAALRFSAIMIYSWVLILHVPRAFFTVQNINEWTALFEALAFASLLFILSRENFIEEKKFARNLSQREIADITKNN